MRHDQGPVRIQFEPGKIVSKEAVRDVKSTLIAKDKKPPTYVAPIPRRVIPSFWSSQGGGASPTASLGASFPREKKRLRSLTGCGSAGKVDLPRRLRKT